MTFLTPSPIGPDYDDWLDSETDVDSFQDRLDEQDPYEWTARVQDDMCDETGSVVVGTLWLIAAALLAANILFALGH